MDRFYSKEDVRQTIESLTAEHVVKDKMHLSRVLKEHTIIRSATIQRDEDAGVWRIVCQNADDGTLEEMVFTITGALMQKEKTRFLSQSVQLVGLGSNMFDNVVAAIKEIQVMGEREFREGEMEEWKPTMAKEFVTVDLTNDEEGIPISQDVNPAGILAKMAQHRWIHTEDNVVRYYRGTLDDEGKKRYVPAKPQMFRVGDIVEVQCSLVFMKTNEGAVRMKLILRALALVNSNHSSKANADRRNAVNTQSPSILRMKRKIGFEEEEDDEGYVGAKKVNRSDDKEWEEGMVTDA
ncbi:hypothetical protein ARMSODRAFT_978521 [Armillaria solidipes]|uniref:Uncharacterized protein n=1 Tax=Armillaria solidipes TaxID=1076256 RepID=A0A2H3BDK1_9AGAR|nr:hypothetical protein ARMSODRAFT_978521 [Armillaria solidipes]